jgi:hypothetical protein
VTGLDKERTRRAIAARLGALRAQARADHQAELEAELARALGVDPATCGWPTLVAVAAGVRAIADAALGTLTDVDDDRRRELLAAFGVAQEWAAVRLAAEMSRSELVPGPEGALPQCSATTVPCGLTSCQIHYPTTKE